MKNRSVSLALAAVAFAFPGLAVADTVDADALVLEIAADVTNTLSEALGALDPAVSIGDVNGGSMANRQIVKTGDGTLLFNTAINSYTGRILIKEGTAICSIRYGLGTGSNGAVESGTEVESGATLFMDASGQTEGWTAVEKERIAFCGEGYLGQGAIYAKNRDKVASWTLGFAPVLTGNATVMLEAYSGTASSASAFGLTSSTLDLAGHTLTLHGVTVNRSRPFFNLLSSNVTSGRIVLENMILMTQNIPYFVGDGNGELVLGDNAVWRPGHSSDLLPWRFVVDDGCDAAAWTGNNPENYGDAAGYNPAHSWNGPIHLGSDLALGITNKRNMRNNFSFTNVVSGAGGFRQSFYQYQSVHPTNFNVHLHCRYNTFQGGVTLGKGSGLYLYDDGALPANGGAANLTDGELRLVGTNATYTLPSAVFTATGSSQVRMIGGKGTWLGNVEKEGPGTLGYYSAVGGPLLDVKAGSVRFARRRPGFVTGFKKFGGGVAASGAQNTDFDSGRTVYTNYFSACADPFFGATPWHYINAMEGNNVAYYYYQNWTCVGYLVNDGEAANWTFAAGIAHGERLILDENDELFSLRRTAYSLVSPTNATRRIEPGLHRFELRAYARNNNPLGSDVPLNVITNWSAAAAGCALLVDRQGRNSKNFYDYEPLLDPGDGSVFAFTDDAEENAAYVPSFGKIRFAAGTSLDVNGHSYVANDIEGLPTVTGGDLTVTGKWSVAASDLANGAKMTVSGNLTFGEGSVIDIASGGVKLESPLAIALSTGGAVSGTPAVTVDGASPNSRYVARISGNALSLAKRGTMISLR